MLTYMQVTNFETVRFFLTLWWKNFENRLFDKVIAVIWWFTFCWTQCVCWHAYRWEVFPYL